MKICVVGKFPPIQGGVSTQTFNTSFDLVRRGHEVDAVTNASEVEANFRQMLLPGDFDRNFNCHITEGVASGAYIPWAQPYLSKLFGKTIQVVEENNPDLLVGWYMEPYGLVASLVGQIFNIPVILRHAGSDIGRLAKYDDLARAYKWAFRSAEAILTVPTTAHVLVELGAKESQLVMLGASRLPAYFAKPEPFPFQEFCKHAKDFYRDFSIPDESLEVPINSLGNIPQDGLPIIGSYGKVGDAKGTYNLLNSLHEIAREGSDFSLVMIHGGHNRELNKFYKELHARKELLDRTLLLPFVSPRWVPSFIKACTATCFLERNFSISFHGPRIPLEILSAGGCLIGSGEVLDKQYFHESLIPDRNHLRVHDPKDEKDLADQLRKVIHNTEFARSIAARGKFLARSMASRADGDAHASAIESVRA